MGIEYIHEIFEYQISYIMKTRGFGAFCTCELYLRILEKEGKVLKGCEDLENWVQYRIYMEKYKDRHPGALKPTYEYPNRKPRKLPWHIRCKNYQVQNRISSKGEA